MWWVGKDLSLLSYSNDLRARWLMADLVYRCIIVDSTRRGKRMPDALSKTIPIWCAVLNRLLFEDDWDVQNLQTPEWAVGASEHAQIEARLDDRVQGAKVRTTWSILSLQLTVKASVLSLILATYDLCSRDQCAHYGSLQNILRPLSTISLPLITL